MAFKELLQKFGQGAKQRKERIKDLDEQIRIQKIVEDRMKSSNERELERFMKENREESIKKQLEEMREVRKKDIRFNHNPLNVKNITKNVQWEVLKEKNMFSGRGNMFTNRETVMRNNPNLLKSNMRLLT